MLQTRRPTDRRAYTLVELAFVLTLLAVGAAAMAAHARRLADRAAVVAAREEVVRALGRVRAAAIARGGAELVVVASPASLRVIHPGSAPRALPLAAGDVRVVLGANRDSTRFRFDRLGIGRFASATVLLRRGRAEAALVVSSYGRARRVPPRW